jgi:hypothetical protein
LPGDAIADPLAGIAAALAAYTFARRGGGVLLDVALCAAAAAALASGGAPGEARVLRRGQGWAVETHSGLARVAPPRARRGAGRARPLGADTRAVLAEVGVAC